MTPNDMCYRRVPGSGVYKLYTGDAGWRNRNRLVVRSHGIQGPIGTAIFLTLVRLPVTNVASEAVTASAIYSEDYYLQ